MKHFYSIVVIEMAGELSGRVLAQGLESLWFKPLSQHAVVEVSSPFASSLCFSY